MNDLKKTAALLRHVDKEERRLAIQALGKSQDPEALKYLAWVLKNESDADLKALALEAGNQLNQELQAAKASGFESYESFMDDKPVEKNYTPIGISQADLEAKERRIQASFPEKRYDLIDNLLGFILILGFFFPLFFPHWLDLSAVPLETGETYGEALEAEKDAINRGQGSPDELIANINIVFDQFEIINLLLKNSSYTPFTVIYTDSASIRRSLQDLGYMIPNERLIMRVEGMSNMLGISTFGYLGLLLLGAGLLVVNMPVRGFRFFGWRFFGIALLRALVIRIPPRVNYGMALALCLMIFSATWICFTVYASPFVAAILENQNLRYLPYNLLSLSTWEFWFYQIYLIMLICLCLVGMMRHSPTKSLNIAGKVKNNAK